ncbi:HIT family protein [Oxyplasma meridianum]|uniref:HIT family protein n=1 Tax=Oxyplasma meridianum TaxID=3073602 RepID=A0AAX4NGG4_9ARCH
MDPCVFCRIVQRVEPAFTVYEDKHVMAFLDNNPFSVGHTLVIPKRHFINMFDMDEDTLCEVIAVVHTLVKRYEKKMGMSGVDILNLNGSDGQQTVYHFHMHIIPRTKDDHLVPWIETIPRVKVDLRSVQTRLKED